MVSGMKKKKNPNPPENKELHMFMWSSSASSGSEANLRNAMNRASALPRRRPVSVSENRKDKGNFGIS